jgi:predicted molibdopterin-dependent oxidoreductase YjgC
MSLGQFHRVVTARRRPVVLSLDGEPLTALEGDTVMTAILTRRRRLRSFEFGAEPRAGFCLMGACQDCWVRTSDGQEVQACSTLVETGMHIRTKTDGSDVGA